MWWSVAVQIPASTSGTTTKPWWFRGALMQRKPRQDSLTYFSDWGHACQWWELSGSFASSTMGCCLLQRFVSVIYCVAKKNPGPVLMSGLKLKKQQERKARSDIPWLETKWWNARVYVSLSNVVGIHLRGGFAAYSIENTCLIGAFILIRSFMEQAWLISACHHLVLTETIHF